MARPEKVRGSVSRNTLKHIKSVVSAIFTLAKQQDYFHAENPARDTAINPGAAEPQETYAYSLEEIHTILSRLPEPAGTAFAMGSTYNYDPVEYGDLDPTVSIDSSPAGHSTA
jgi:hypothetical protein